MVGNAGVATAGARQRVMVFSQRQVLGSRTNVTSENNNNLSAGGINPSELQHSESTSSAKLTAERHFTAYPGGSVC